MARDDRHIPLYEQEQFVRLEVNIKTLTRLLSKHQLHAEDVHCDSGHSKKILMQLILATASLEVQPPRPFLTT
jgi:hypothetical protein